MQLLKNSNYLIVGLFLISPFMFSNCYRSMDDQWRAASTRADDRDRDRNEDERDDDDRVSDRPRRSSGGSSSRRNRSYSSTGTVTDPSPSTPSPGTPSPSTPSPGTPQPTPGMSQGGGRISHSRSEIETLMETHFASDGFDADEEDDAFWTCMQKTQQLWRTQGLEKVCTLLGRCTSRFCRSLSGAKRDDFIEDCADAMGVSTDEYNCCSQRHSTCK